MANENFSGGNDPKDKLESGMEHASQAASDFGDAAKGATQGAQSEAAGRAGDLKSQASAKFDDLKSAAAQKADEFKTAASQKADEWRGQAEGAWDDAKVRARTFQEDGEQYVRENPSKAVLYALGVGFVLGLILRK